MMTPALPPHSRVRLLNLLLGVRLFAGGDSFGRAVLAMLDEVLQMLWRIVCDCHTTSPTGLEEGGGREGKAFCPPPMVAPKPPARAPPAPGHDG